MTQGYDIGKIFQEYRRKVYGLALSLTRNEKDAEDVVQNTFAKIISNLDRFRNDSRISTWIYRIAYNEALMSLRKKSLSRKYSTNLARGADNGTAAIFVNWSKLPDEELVDKELKETVDSAISRLPIKYRMALLLHSFNDLPLKDTAGILNLKSNSLKTRIHRALMLLKKEISDYLADKAPKEKGKTCSLLTGFILDYATGSFTVRKKSAFDKHISDCTSCKSFLNNYDQAMRLTKALECRDLPLELQKKIQSFINK